MALSLNVIDKTNTELPTPVFYQALTAEFEN